MAKHRLIAQPRQHPTVWLRLAQAIGVVVLLLLAYGVVSDLGTAQDAAVPTQVDPTPHAVDVASTPVLRLAVPRGV
jgi:hypothetical protein